MDALNFKPALRKSLVPLTGAAKKKPAFKFTIAKAETLFSQNVKLKGGGVVKVTAKRNSQETGNIKKIGKLPEQKDQQWNCEIIQWQGNVHTKDPVILNSNFDKLYPGVIYPYESIANGDYKPLPFGRKPLSINVDGVHFNKAAIVVQNPTKGTVRQAIVDIVKTKTGEGSARSYGQKFEVYSEEDLFVRTGGSGYFLTAGGSHQIDYKNNSKSHKYFLEVYQAYYTISVNDNVHEPTDFFVTKEEQPTAKDAVAAKDINPNWVYVDSMTYGRMLQVMFQSDESFDEVGIDIEGHADFLFAGGKANFNMKQQSVLQNTSVELVAVGGNPVYSAQAVNASSLQELKERIDKYFTGHDDEQPISYTLRTLDQENVGANMITDFTSRQCAPRASKYAVTWDNVQCINADDESGGEEVKAMVRIRAFSGNGKDILDEDKFNNPIIINNSIKQTGLPIPMPWTFTKGTEDHPINLNSGEQYALGKKIVFTVDKNDDKAKIGIRADILEYDGAFSGNDDFADALWEKKITEITGKEIVRLMCTDDDSRIQFNFTVTPVYD
ncbi:hypothetical protein A4H97_23700 [Niastella yeongjuensis]|uniref:Thiol-activated cytolysin n=2 Tax=Niastella yeongjuensis TaxID=354355 RepID=A0A1V9F5B2_9BACT|nr:hypothetical protein A4H97_23700 [Niastella yeongjuensis]